MSGRNRQPAAIVRLPDRSAELMTAEISTDPRARRTRRLILESFMELKAEGEPFKSISVSAITRRAGVNRATFYDHFTDKFDLVDAWMRTLFQRGLPEGLAESPLDDAGLRALAEATLALLSRYVDRKLVVNRSFEPMLESAVRDEIHQTVRSMLAATQTARLARVERIAQAISWTLYGVALEWAQASKRAPRAEVIADLVVLTKQLLR